MAFVHIMIPCASLIGRGLRLVLDVLSSLSLGLVQLALLFGLLILFLFLVSVLVLCVFHCSLSVTLRLELSHRILVLYDNPYPIYPLRPLLVQVQRAATSNIFQS